jgi:hypothetical protein
MKISVQVIDARSWNLKVNHQPQKPRKAGWDWVPVRVAMGGAARASKELSGPPLVQAEPL